MYAVKVNICWKNMFHVADFRSQWNGC